VTLNAGTGAVNFGGGTNNGVGLGNRFGTFTVTQADAGVVVYESTTLNLGSITSIGGGLRAYSSAGDIVNSGTLNISGVGAGVLLGAGTAAAPGNITLDNANNVLGTGLTILDDLALLSNSAPGATVGNLLAKDLTVVSAGNFSLPRLISTYGTGISGNLSITSKNGAIDLSATTATATDAIVAAGTVTLNAPGAIEADNTSNRIGTVNVTSNGIVNIVSKDALTVNATLTGTTDATFNSGQKLTIGTVSSSRTAGTVKFVAGNKQDIVDSVTGISIFGAVNFDSNGGVNVTRAGHSFGGVSVTVRNNKEAKLTESGTLKLVSVDSNTDGKANLTFTSTSGDILQTGAITGGDNGSTATFNALSGKVILDNAGNTLKNAVAVTAAGDATVVLSTNDLLLGNITAGGKLTINQTSNDKKVSQKSGTKINAFDMVTITSNGTDAADRTKGSITVANSGNRLGAVVLSAGEGNIAITESTTLNLVSVLTKGGLTAESESGSIIDSARSVTSNFIAADTTPAALGTAKFTAKNGNVTLGLSGSNYSSVAFDTTGNASILDSAGSLSLAASTVGGTLNIVSTASGATLSQTGAVKAAGDVTITTNNGNVLLDNTGNEFGGVRFTANQVTLTEATTLNLRAGSVATGVAQLSSILGGFVTSGSGSSTFTSDLTISAAGTIVPSANSLSVVGTFTVFSNNLKDLSALSQAGNLTNKAPVNLGTGEYKKPFDAP
jgi:hypothetical protein